MLLFQTIHHASVVIRDITVPVMDKSIVVDGVNHNSILKHVLSQRLNIRLVLKHNARLVHQDG